MTHDYYRMFKLWWKSPRLLALILHLAYLKVLSRVFQLRQFGAVTEKVLMCLMAEFSHLQQYRRLGIEILNAQKKPIRKSLIYL